ncbi:MAG: DUF4128 domain-containing protein [Pseudomonadales bacterium]|nr:DUF4128 domain-containing protein [Pseudomonadales bacterium]
MSTHFLDISAALSGRLNTLTDLPPVAWMNRIYSPVDGTLFLKEFWMPGEVEQSDLGTSGRDFHQGIYQVNIFCPTNNAKNEGLVLADRIADHFARSTTLTYNDVNLRITKTKIVGGAPDGAWWIVPVEIHYETYLSPR